MQETPTKRRTRRSYPPEFKRKITQTCQQPGASVAAIALAHGVNANLVHRWLRQAEPGRGALTLTQGESGGEAFVALSMPAAGMGTMAPEPIRLELRRGASSVSLQWPASAASQCGAWLREWLR